MSHDLRHHNEWLETHPKAEVNTSEYTYGILRYRCGSGWQIPHVNLSLVEARWVKNRYKEEGTNVKIFQEIQ